ncbi:unnamed protein product [Vitrella brassicaformis CCMP3155]|uniref:Uncharacterized protein n=1 Tax=Vitrella brassicaformis (strain CCMP3155) TaxID=1169540 RepID=A0A0G4EY66_VITBC|nr:unnamed protein product [Vitrella brassicaformis CCMP3155]|eukprot:CEM03375.1 unnamed protein product [Vitrella brassicaformis CCMP3155]
MWLPRPVPDFPSPSSRRGACDNDEEPSAVWMMQLGSNPPLTTGGGVPMRRDVVHRRCPRRRAEKQALSRNVERLNDEVQQERQKAAQQEIRGTESKQNEDDKDNTDTGNETSKRAAQILHYRGTEGKQNEDDKYNTDTGGLPGQFSTKASEDNDIKRHITDMIIDYRHEPREGEEKRLFVWPAKYPLEFTGLPAPQEGLLLFGPSRKGDAAPVRESARIAAMQQQLSAVNYATLTADKVTANRKRQRDAQETVTKLLGAEEERTSEARRNCRRLQEKRILGELGSYKNITAETVAANRDRQRKRVARRGRQAGV